MIEIDNKYNIGDTLWRMYENKPTLYSIAGIKVNITATEVELGYMIRRQGYCTTIYNEDQVGEIFYPTKEKCILSLFDK